MGEAGTKRCSKCGRELPLEEFSVCRSNPRDGRQGYCKACMREYLRGYGVTETPVRECEHCGKAFRPAHGRQRYCSAACRTIARYRRVLEAGGRRGVRRKGAADAGQ